MRQEIEDESKPPTVWASLLALPGWTALLVVGTFLAAIASVMSDGRLGVQEGIGMVLAYTGMSVALKLLVLLGVRVWTSGRFVMSEMRHVAAILVILIVSVAVATPAMLAIWTKEQLEKAKHRNTEIQRHDNWKRGIQEYRGIQGYGNTGTAYVFTVAGDGSGSAWPRFRAEKYRDTEIQGHDTYFCSRELTDVAQRARP